MKSLYGSQQIQTCQREAVIALTQPRGGRSTRVPVVSRPCTSGNRFQPTCRAVRTARVCPLPVGTLEFTRAQNSRPQSDLGRNHLSLINSMLGFIYLMILSKWLNQEVIFLMNLFFSLLLIMNFVITVQTNEFYPDDSFLILHNGPVQVLSISKKNDDFKIKFKDTSGKKMQTCTFLLGRDFSVSCSHKTLFTIASCDFHVNGSGDNIGEITLSKSFILRQNKILKREGCSSSRLILRKIVFSNGEEKSF
jgi:hypothetical protein